MNDRRLLACAALCKGDKAVDVGTDHGHLAAYLVTEGICSRCVACDINEKPLNSARKTIAETGLTDRVEILLSDGLDSVAPDGVTDVIIAGMGGELIAEIVGRAEWLKENKVNLVLQPMTKWDHLRKRLYEDGFEVTKEIACEEGRFVYSVMQAVYIGRQPDYPCDLCYLYGGRADPNTAEGRKYLCVQADRLERAGEGMLRSAENRENGEKMLAAATELRKLLL